MADSFRKIVDLPPLRITAQELTGRVEELAAEMSSGGEVNVTYEVSFEDGTSFKCDSSSDFLANLDSDGEPLAHVEVTIHAWTSPPPENEWGREIAKNVLLRLRNYGSDIYVASANPMWGKGAIETVKARFNQYSPWYARLYRAFPMFSGVLTPLPFFFITVAVLHERKVTALLGWVAVLSSLFLLLNTWLWRQYLKRRVFAHTVVFRGPPQRGWTWLTALVGATALAADAATLVVILLR